MTQFYNNTLCMKAGWLIDLDIITASNYKQLSYRNILNAIRRGYRNTPALMEYDSIPEQFKKQIVKKLSDPHTTTKHFGRFQAQFSKRHWFFTEQNVYFLKEK